MELIPLPLGGALFLISMLAGLREFHSTYLKQKPNLSKDGGLNMVE